MQNMPEKDPGFWAALLVVLQDHGLAAILTFVLSYVRILYDDKESSVVRQLIEAALGALMVLTIGLTAENFGLSSGWSYGAAGFIGTLGVNQIRSIARRWAVRKADAL
jgi:lambda family phage holin